MEEVARMIALHTPAQTQPDALTGAELQRVIRQAAHKRGLDFYRSYAWAHKRAEVLAMDHNECVMCRAHGKHSQANTVHHVWYLSKRPELALSIWYIGTDGVPYRQLVSLCHDCHEEQHAHRHSTSKQTLTDERW